MCPLREILGLSGPSSFCMTQTTTMVRYATGDAKPQDKVTMNETSRMVSQIREANYCRCLP